MEIVHIYRYHDPVCSSFNVPLLDVVSLLYWVVLRWKFHMRIWDEMPLHRQQLFEFDVPNKCLIIWIVWVIHDVLLRWHVYCKWGLCIQSPHFSFVRYNSILTLLLMLSPSVWYRLVFVQLYRKHISMSIQFDVIRFRAFDRSSFIDDNQSEMREMFIIHSCKHLCSNE